MWKKAVVDVLSWHLVGTREKARTADLPNMKLSATHVTAMVGTKLTLNILLLCITLREQRRVSPYISHYQAADHAQHQYYVHKNISYDL
jgi:hypothetical protein